MDRLAMTRRGLALALVVLGGALLVAAAAVAWGVAAALAVAGAESVAFGLLFVDVAPRQVKGVRGGVTAPFGSRAA